MTIADWCQTIHELAHRQGFYVGKCSEEVACKHRSGGRPGALMLIVTELAEALEADRKGDDHNFYEEIADAVIRLFDLAAAEGILLEHEIALKMEQNRQRCRRHGKKY